MGPSDTIPAENVGQAVMTQILNDNAVRDLRHDPAQRPELARSDVDQAAIRPEKLRARDNGKIGPQSNSIS